MGRFLALLGSGTQTSFKAMTSDKEQGVSRRKAALQFTNLDPRRRIHAWSPE